jgi:aldehyde dehydrogenase (NAD+)
MYDCRQFFINGEWLAPTGRQESLVINPATEEPVGRILLGTAADVDAATRAAKIAFERYSQTTREERISLFERIVKIYEANIDRLAWAVSDEQSCS